MESARPLEIQTVSYWEEDLQIMSGLQRVKEKLYPDVFVIDAQIFIIILLKVVVLVWEGLLFNAFSWDCLKRMFPKPSSAPKCPFISMACTGMAQVNTSTLMGRWLTLVRPAKCTVPLNLVDFNGENVSQSLWKCAVFLSNLVHDSGGLLFEP